MGVLEQRAIPAVRGIDDRPVVVDASAGAHSAAAQLDRLTGVDIAIAAGARDDPVDRERGPRDVAHGRPSGTACPVGAHDQPVATGPHAVVGTEHPYVAATALFEGAVDRIAVEVGVERGVLAHAHLHAHRRLTTVDAETGQRQQLRRPASDDERDAIEVPVVPGLDEQLVDPGMQPRPRRRVAL